MTIGKVISTLSRFGSNIMAEWMSGATQSYLLLAQSRQCLLCKTWDKKWDFNPGVRLYSKQDRGHHMHAAHNVWAQCFEAIVLTQKASGNPCVGAQRWPSIICNPDQSNDWLMREFHRMVPVIGGPYYGKSELNGRYCSNWMHCLLPEVVDVIIKSHSDLWKVQVLWPQQGLQVLQHCHQPVSCMVTNYTGWKNMYNRLVYKCITRCLVVMPENENSSFKPRNFFCDGCSKLLQSSEDICLALTAIWWKKHMGDGSAL